MALTDDLDYMARKLGLEEVSTTSEAGTSLAGASGDNAEQLVPDKDTHPESYMLVLIDAHTHPVSLLPSVFLDTR